MILSRQGMGPEEPHLLAIVEEASGLQIGARESVSSYLDVLEATTGENLATLRNLLLREIYGGVTPSSRTDDEERSIQAELQALRTARPPLIAVDPPDDRRLDDRQPDDRRFEAAGESFTSDAGLEAPGEPWTGDVGLQAPRNSGQQTSASGDFPGGMSFGIGLRDWRWWLLLLFAGALALRLITLGSDNVWGDEAFSWTAARLPFSEIGTFERVHPWGYYFLLGRFISVAGDTPWILRLPSVLFSAGTVALVFILFRRIADPMTVTIAAGLLAIAAFSIFWAQEARMYSMLLFFTWLSALALFRLFSTGSRLWLVIYVASAAALPYIHYTGLLILGVQAVYWAYMVSTRQDQRRVLAATAVIAAVAVGAIFAPQFAHFFNVVERGGPSYIEAPGAADIIDAAGSVLGIRLPGWYPDWLLQNSQLFVALLTGFAAVLAIVGARRLWRSDRDSAVFFIIMAAMPIVYAAQSLVGSPTFIPKVLLPYLPAWLFLITWGAVGLAGSAFRILQTALMSRSRLSRLIGLGIVFIILAPLIISNAVVLIDDYLHDDRSDWREVATRLHKLNPDLIVMPPRGDANMLKYVYQGPARVERVKETKIDTYRVPRAASIVTVLFKTRQDSIRDRISTRLRQRLEQFRDILAIEIVDARLSIIIFGKAKYELENVSVWPSRPVKEIWITTQDGYLMAKKNAEFRTEIPEGRAFTVEMSFGPEVSQGNLTDLIRVAQAGKGTRKFLVAAAGLGIRHSEMDNKLAFCMPKGIQARPTFVVRQGTMVQAIKSYEGCDLK